MAPRSQTQCVKNLYRSQHKNSCEDSSYNLRWKQRIYNTQEPQLSSKSEITDSNAMPRKQRTVATKKGVTQEKIWAVVLGHYNIIFFGESQLLLSGPLRISCWWLTLHEISYVRLHPCVCIIPRWVFAIYLLRGVPMNSSHFYELWYESNVFFIEGTSTNYKNWLPLHQT